MIAEEQDGLAVATKPDAYDQFQRTKYFASLDGLRAISILSVIWYHIPDTRQFWRTGFLGVQLFFTISGFLITTILLREQKRTGTISLRNFYVRRILRIFPAYYGTIALILGVCLFTHMLDASKDNFYHNLPFFLTFTSNWYVDPGAIERVVFVIAWSLATEEQFYFFWPSVVRYAKNWYTPVMVMIGLILANQITRLFVGYPFFLKGYAWPILAMNSISTAICLGSLLAYALHRRSSFERAYKVLGQWWSAPLFFACMALLFYVPQSDDLSESPTLFIVISMVLAVGSAVIRGDHIFRTILSNPVSRYIGTISYGMYLYHNFAINFCAMTIPNFRSLAQGEFVLVTIVSVAMASLSYWLYEKRFLDLKDRWTKPA